MKKKDEIELYEELEYCLKETESIYKSSNLIKKFCELKKDSDDLYEISDVVNILTERINNLSRDLYRIIHKNEKVTSFIYWEK